MGDDVHVPVRFFSNIEGNLWTGASPVEMPDYFTTVLNLFPWGHYKVPKGTDYRSEKLFDGDDVDTGLVYELAGWAHERLHNGPLLIHCQAGINRSNLVASLVLMKNGWDPNGAVRLLRERRSPLVLANRAFYHWILSQPFPIR